MMENRSYHSLSNSWDFTTGSKRSTPDQTHELVHDMEEGRAIPGYVRVASDLVDFNVLSTSRAGIVTTLAGPSNSVVKSERLIQLRHGDVKRGETPPSTQFSPSLKRSKRNRSVNLSNQIPICQVYGCNLNLSSSKEYHKKHKVCEMHSKTAKVIVSGLEQRFCQQCSRFHLLAEFDDGKRSCRKRLAGHNQRRRKPQIELRDYGHKFMEMIPSSQTPCLCANILSAGIGREVKYGTIAKGHSCVKAEPNYSYHPSSLALIQHGNSKHLSTFQASSVGICSEDSERYSLDHLARASSSSQAQLMKTFPENESFFPAQGITSVSDTGCALSLLSTQPHNFFIQASGVTTDRPLFAQNDHRSAHSNANPLSGTVPSYSQFSSTSVAPNRFFSSGHNHMNVDHHGALPASDASNTDIRDHIAGTASSLDCVDEKNGMYTDRGTSNVDTIHLSSQLHGMNSQRSSMQVKMAKEDFMSCIGL